MNLPTDLEDRMKINRQRRALGKELRAQARAKAESSRSKRDEGGFPVDKVHIEVENLRFRYTNHPMLLKDVTCTFEQGKLYAFVGPAHKGKATLMKLLGQVLLPQVGGGTIFIPPHLRILHVDQDNGGSHISGTFLDNILLNSSLEKVGYASGGDRVGGEEEEEKKRRAGRERVMRICKRLNFEDKVIDGLDDDIGKVAVHLTHTASARLALARVFVMNPEIVVIHKPAVVFGAGEAKAIIGLFREHVDRRGLALPAETRKYRRPRTVFFTSGTMAGVQLADEVFEVCSEGGLRKIAADDVEPDELN